MENSPIAWTMHTFNPWIGCCEVSPACDNCYAAAWDSRFEGGKRWGPHAPRRRTAESTWAQPLKWDRKAATLGIRHRVFCASLADVFDNHRSIPDLWRRDLWALIAATPNLDWLLLTKRPQNIGKYKWWLRSCKNIWLGATVENQEEAGRRIPHLTRHDEAVTFLSCEPLLGPLDLTQWIGDIDWVITGGENARDYRSAEVDWYRSLRDQCSIASVPFLFKQWSGPSQQIIKGLGRELDGKIFHQIPGED